jgi:hypothetical protein
MFFVVETEEFQQVDFEHEQQASRWMMLIRSITAFHAVFSCAYLVFSVAERVAMSWREGLGATNSLLSSQWTLDCIPDGLSRWVTLLFFGEALEKMIVWGELQPWQLH